VFALFSFVLSCIDIGLASGQYSVQEDLPYIQVDSYISKFKTVNRNRTHMSYLEADDEIFTHVDFIATGFIYSCLITITTFIVLQN